MKRCSRCHEILVHSAVELFLAQQQVRTLPTMDALCASLDRLAQARTTTAHALTPEQQDLLRREYAAAVRHARRVPPPVATRASVLERVRVWLRAHHGVLPTGAMIRAAGHPIGVSQGVFYHLFADLWDLYGACLDAGLCSEADIVRAARAMRRLPDARAWLSARQHARTREGHDAPQP